MMQQQNTILMKDVESLAEQLREANQKHLNLQENSRIETMEGVLKKTSPTMASVKVDSPASNES